jgi:hypothetical protein
MRWVMSGPDKPTPTRLGPRLPSVVRKVIAGSLVCLAVAGCSGSTASLSDRAICQTVRGGLDQAAKKYNLVQLPTGFMSELQGSHDTAFEHAGKTCRQSDFYVLLDKRCSALGF